MAFGWQRTLGNRQILKLDFVHECGVTGAKQGCQLRPRSLFRYVRLTATSPLLLTVMCMALVSEDDLQLMSLALTFQVVYKDSNRTLAYLGLDVAGADCLTHLCSGSLQKDTQLRIQAKASRRDLIARMQRQFAAAQALPQAADISPAPTTRCLQVAVVFLLRVSVVCCLWAETAWAVEHLPAISRVGDADRGYRAKDITNPLGLLVPDTHTHTHTHTHSWTQMQTRAQTQTPGCIKRDD